MVWQPCQRMNGSGLLCRNGHSESLANSRTQRATALGSRGHAAHTKPSRDASRTDRNAAAGLEYSRQTPSRGSPCPGWPRSPVEVLFSSETLFGSSIHPTRGMFRWGTWDMLVSPCKEWFLNVNLQSNPSREMLLYGPRTNKER